MLKLQSQQINNFDQKRSAIDLLKKVSKNILNISISQNVKEARLTWDNTQMMKNMKYCNPPRFLIVEVR
jgi:hypothetical protein